MPVVEKYVNLSFSVVCTVRLAIKSAAAPRPGIGAAASPVQLSFASGRAGVCGPTTKSALTVTDAPAPNALGPIPAMKRRKLASRHLKHVRGDRA
jgi:hypothetical protein